MTNPQMRNEKPEIEKWKPKKQRNGSPKWRNEKRTNDIMKNLNI